MTAIAVSDASTTPDVIAVKKPIVQESTKNVLQRTVTWSKEHKQQILVALLILGLTTLTLGIGLLAGAAGGTTVIGATLIGKNMVTYLTTAGGIAMAGGIMMGIGGMIATFAAGAFLALKNR